MKTMFRRSSVSENLVATLMMVSLSMAVAAVLPAYVVAEPGPPAHLAPLDSTGLSFRLYEGVTLLVNNPDGKAFTVKLDVRDLNLIETGPREVLFKVYDPDGKAVVREVIPDDGVAAPISQSPAGGWDQEAWYYTYQYAHGAPPMLRWSGLDSPQRLAAVPVRTFDRQVPGGHKGIYRIVLVGSRDHVVTVGVDPALPYAVAGDYFMHPIGDFLKKRFVYIPKGTIGASISMVEWDRPRSRRFTLRDQAGKVLIEANAAGGIVFADANVEKPGDWDDKVFSLEVSDGPNACMVQLTLMRGPVEGQQMYVEKNGGVSAFYAADEATARALNGGAIYHDNQCFWAPQQVRLYDWLGKLTPADFEPRDANGVPAKIITLPNAQGGKALDLQPNRNEEFVTLNGPHWTAPISDTIMFSYDLNKNRQALNIALRDLATALRGIGPGDYCIVIQRRGMSNLAYAFGTYGWHWWRPAWRVLQKSDAPAEVKDLLRESFINAGDRLAFCRNWERINGNAFVTVLCGLRYACEATGDGLHRQLLDTFFDRFTNGGWGPRVGLGPSGLIQEHYAYDNHYSSYPINTIGSVADDLGDARFAGMREGMLRVFSYTMNDEVAANPFNARTQGQSGYAFVRPHKDGPYAWKGYPGPEFTESINGANEFFAARRKGYYILSYHGRMSPKWANEALMGQSGWSGGVLCQFVVPGKGTVLASTMDSPGYGKNMHPSQWPTFRIHSLVGQTADGMPLVAADSEHMNARLEGNTVTGSGEVRNSSVAVTRSYTYNRDHVVSEVRLRMTDDDILMSLVFKSLFRGYVAEAWEMIPFLPNKLGKPADSNKPEDATTVKVLDAAGKEAGDLGASLLEGQSVVIDRGGFGVRIELEKPMMLKRGKGNTVMIQLLSPLPIGPHDPAKEKPNADQIGLRYRLVPFQ